MKIKASKVMNCAIPKEIYLQIENGKITAINQDDFEETELSISDIAEIKRLKKKIKETAANALLNEYKNHNTIAEILNKNFILMDEPAMALSAALIMEQNVIFCGRGGYGKSEMIKTLFSNELLKDKVFIKSLNESTTEEDLFGGIKMKELMDEGSILYKTENSFINYEIAIFEEMLDADISVLSALKDALSSKEVRNGIQREVLKTKIIIGLTNKSPQDVISNNSTEALIQRFPIIQTMEYPITKDVVALMILRSMRNPLHITAEDLLKKEVLYANMDKMTPRKIMQIIKFIDSQISINGNSTKIADIPTKEIFKTKETISNNLSSTKKEFIRNTKLVIEESRTKGLYTKKQLEEYDSIIGTWK